MKFVLIIIMFVIAGCFQVDRVYSSEISLKYSVKNKENSIIPVKRYYLLLKLPSKRRRDSNEAHFFVGKPQENLDIEDLMNIYSLLNQTEITQLHPVNNKYVLDKKNSGIVNLPIMYQLQENKYPEKQELYIFGTPKINWIMKGQSRNIKPTTVNDLTSNRLPINNPKLSKGSDHDIIIEEPFVSWITNELPIEPKSSTIKT